MFASPPFLQNHISSRYAWKRTIPDITRSNFIREARVQSVSLIYWGSMPDSDEATHDRIMTTSLHRDRTTTWNWILVKLPRSGRLLPVIHLGFTDRRILPNWSPNNCLVKRSGFSAQIPTQSIESKVQNVMAITRKPLAMWAKGKFLLEKFFDTNDQA